MSGKLISMIWQFVNLDLKTISIFIYQNMLTISISLLVILALYVFKYFILLIKVLCKNREWYGVAQKKKQQFDDLCKNLSKKDFYKSDSIPKNKEDLILKSDAQDLLKLLKTRKVTSVELVNFYTKRCLDKAVSLNLVTDFLYDEAIEKAKSADKLYEQFKNDPNWVPKKLLGLPISLKDAFYLKGHDTTLGTATQAFKPSEKNGYIIDVLEENGAIPFVVSNVSQFMNSYETNNPIWGRAMNPWNKDRSTGGTSGGEAGLISYGCSPLGIATENQGGIRVPALACGVYGYKSSFRRVLNEGVKYNFTEQWNHFTCIGPLTRSVRDIELVMDVIADATNIQAKGYYQMAPIPWKSEKVETSGKTIKKFGYIKEQPDFPCSDANKRAVMDTVKRLSDAGYECIEYTWPEHEAWNWAYQCGTNIVQKSRVESVDGEKILPEYSMINFISNLPTLQKYILLGILKQTGQNRLFKTIGYTICKNIMDYWYMADIQMLGQYHLQAHVKSLGIECIIMPGLPFCALKHGLSDKLYVGCLYTFMLNSFDKAVGVLPITYVNKEETSYRENEYGDDIFNRAMKENCSGSENQPVGIQLFSALPWQEEKLISAMKIIEELTPRPNLPVKQAK